MLDDAAMKALYAQLTSPLRALGPFKAVTAHEPMGPPAGSPAAALWWSGGPEPARGLSGLGATSLRLEFTVRVYVTFTRAGDNVDPILLGLVSKVAAVFSSGFTLSGEAMEVDLLGAYGAPLAGKPGYANFGDQEFRISDITVPVIIDDGWEQVP